MRGLALLGVCALVGCAPDGIFVEVTPPTGTQTAQVDLYIASFCEDCPAVIKPEGFVAQGVRGDVFTHDGVEYRAAVEDGAAWFELRGEGVLPLVLAVGTTAGGEVTGVAVMRDTVDLGVGSRHYLAPLDPVEPLAENAPRDPARAGVHAWPAQRATPRPPCLAVDAIAPKPHTYLVVPDTGDFDCDGLLAQDGECAPFVFAGDKIDPASHCAVPATRKFPGDPPTCVAGHTVVCQDFPDPQNVHACVEDYSFDDEIVCLPEAVCGLPATTNTPDKHLAVLAGLGSPQLSCTLLGERDANNTFVPCTEPSVAFSLHVPLMSCSDLPALIAYDDPSLVADPERLYDAGGAGVPLAFGQAKIEVETFESCNLSLRWQGQIIDAPPDVSALVKVFFEAGGEQRAVFLPAKFHFEEGCAIPAGTCALDGAAPDPMYACGS